MRAMTKKDSSLTFLEHLDELRLRLIRCVIFFSVAAFLVYGQVDRILPWILEPIGHVVFTAPSEAFMAYVLIAIWGGLFLSAPYVLYEIWKFIAGGLLTQERKYIAFFLPLSVIFFLAGCLFAYYVVLPIGLEFFLSFSNGYIVPMITVSKYLSFLGTMVLSFGVVFELPLAVVFLTRVGIATPRFLAEKRRYAIIAIFIVSTVLTPPDVASQLLMAVPLLALYEISILFSFLTCRMNAKREHAGFQGAPS